MEVKGALLTLVQPPPLPVSDHCYTHSRGSFHQPPLPHSPSSCLSEPNISLTSSSNRLCLFNSFAGSCDDRKGSGRSAWETGGLINLFSHSWRKWWPSTGTTLWCCNDTSVVVISSTHTHNAQRHTKKCFCWNQSKEIRNVFTMLGLFTFLSYHLRKGRWG